MNPKPEKDIQAMKNFAISLILLEALYPKDLKKLTGLTPKKRIELLKSLKREFDHTIWWLDEFLTLKKKEFLKE